MRNEWTKNKNVGKISKTNLMFIREFEICHLSKKWRGREKKRKNSQSRNVFLNMPPFFSLLVLSCSSRIDFWFIFEFEYMQFWTITRSFVFWNIFFFPQLFIKIQNRTRKKLRKKIFRIIRTHIETSSGSNWSQITPLTNTISKTPMKNFYSPRLYGLSFKTENTSSGCLCLLYMDFLSSKVEVCVFYSRWQN